MILGAAVVIFIISFLILIFLAGIVDLLTMKICNKLILCIFISYVMAAPVANLDIGVVVTSVAIALMVLIIGFALFAFGWIGGGDVKLAAVTALWLGADQTLAYLTWTALFGGVLALGLLLFRRFSLPASWREREWIARLHAPETGIPYGVAMAAAALLVFPNTVWMNALS